MLPTGNIVHYVGNVEFIRSTSGADVEMRRTLAGVAIDLNRGREPRHVRYVFSDHLGSIDAVAGATGALLEAASFDVHGNRRDATSWKGSNGMLPVWSAPVDRPSTTPRGFTSHEHIDGLAFIHMNGRTYDPASGRMMQADPLVDGSLQGLNRYSYVANNPLALTDPTGYSAWGNFLRVAVAIVITIYSGGTAAGAAWGYWGASVTAGQAFAAVVIGGFAAGVVTTGTLQGGVYGAFSAAVFYGIGSTFQSAGWATRGTHVFGTNLNAMGYTAKVVAHGMAGGTMSVLQGGKFGNGFASAGVAQAFSGPIDGLKTVTGQVVAAGVLGGTTSTISGGKFANGAITAAFSRAFNECAHGRCSRSAGQDGGDFAAEIGEYYMKSEHRLNGEPIDIGWNDFEWIADFDMVRVASSGVGQMAPWDWPAYIVGGDGDSSLAMAALFGARFRFLDAPGPFAGVHAANDVNYYYQGYLWNEVGASGNAMRAGIAAWNIKDALLSRSFSEAFRNVNQIRTGTMWADWAYGRYGK